jgi:hypothetical protein
MSGAGHDQIGAPNLQGVINALQQIVLQQGQIYDVLGGIKAALAPTYATGTWTPALNLNGSPTGITYSSQLGTYTQLGRLILCEFRLVLTSKGASNGAATITGLPFTANADTTMAGVGGSCPVYSNLASLAGVPIINVPAGGTTASLLSSGAAASAALSDANFNNNSVLNGHFYYFM